MKGFSLAILTFLLVTACTKESVDSTQHVAFDTPEQAVEALLDAVERHDLQALRTLLGPNTKDLISSGDEIADRGERQAFLEKARAQRELVAGSPNDLVLVVGPERWPLPMPLMRSAEGRWMFDGEAGMHELLVRRIGRNELNTIEVMLGFVEAQHEYSSAAHEGVPAGTYARQLRSDPGKQNGLYWEVAAGEPLSPAGPLLAAAAAEGYEGSEAPNDEATPYHGYLYRMLFSQGADANGGAQDYLEGDRLANGFALLAFPAQYGVTGIMTFAVNQDGLVWQRDLGEDTHKIAPAIDTFNPDPSWTPIPLVSERRTADGRR